MLDRPTPNGVIQTNGQMAQAESLRAEYLAWLEHKRRCSPRTVRTYAWTLDRWLWWAAEAPAAPLSPPLEVLEEFVTRQPAAASQRLAVTTLKGWFRWMLARGHIAEDPTVDLVPPAVRNKRPKPVPAKHWLAMVRADIPASLRCAMGLGYYAGLRNAEIFGLAPSAIDIEDQVLTLVGKGGDEQLLDFGAMIEVVRNTRPDLAEGIDEWLDVLAFHARGQGPRLIGTWTHETTMYKLMQKLCRRLGIPSYTPHQLRHSCATNLANSGLPLHLVQRLMRHGSIDMTLRYVAGDGGDVRNWLLTK